MTIANPRDWLVPVFLATLALKLVLAALLPFSGDEAYFLIWGQRPDFGFYDHPPMVGWLLWLMSRVSEAEWVLRLPVVMFTSFVGYGLYRLLHDWDREKAAWATLLYLLSPLNLLGILMTTDASLILFSFLTVWGLVRALEQQQTQWFVWSGVAFGLACLSKYFAALLGIAIIAYWFATPRARAQSRGMILLFAAALPFIALNVYWNYTHCWANIMFNVFNRHEHADWAWYKPLLYLLEHAYLMSPLALLLLMRQRASLSAAWSDARWRLFLFAFGVPMLIFALLSFKKVIGLHWLMSFYPFFFVLLVFWLARVELQRLSRFMLWYASGHALVLLVTGLLPLSVWQHTPYAQGAVIMKAPQALLEKMEEHRDQSVLAMDNYSAAAILSYHAKENVMVFGAASSHARHDDIVTDYRALDGKNISILLKKPAEFDKYGPYFKSIAFEEIRLSGTPFYMVLGHAFDYASYRERVLREVKHKYYSIPGYLPMGACYFCARYFPDEQCRPEGGP